MNDFEFSGPAIARSESEGDWEIYPQYLLSAAFKAGSPIDGKLVEFNPSIGAYVLERKKTA